MKRTVFISHSSKDKAIAEEICRYLEDNGVGCWIAPRDVTPGKNYGAAIVDAIDECGVFVLVLTSDSNNSNQVVREVERAASSNSVIIPLRVEPVEPSRNLEFYVSSSHWLDAVTKPLDQHLGALLDAIRNWQSSGETAPLTPTQAAASTEPLPSPPRRQSSRFLLIGGAGIAVVLVACLIAYFSLRRPFSQTPAAQTEVPSPPATSAPTATPVAVEESKPTPAPTATPEISATAAPTASPYSFTPTFPTPTATPGRLRPGAPAGLPSTLAVRQVSASTTFKSDDPEAGPQSFEPKRAVDENRTTAWAGKGGVGQWLNIQFTSPVSISSVSIIGGPGIDAPRRRLHNRIKTLRMTFSDGTIQMLEFEDKNKPQHFDLPQAVTAESVKFEIRAIYRATKFDATPIWEIAFNRDAQD